VEQDRPGRRFKRVAGLDVSDAHPGIGTRNPGPIEDEPIWVITGTAPRSRSVPTQACSTSNQGSRGTRAHIRSEPVFPATALWRTGLLEGFERDLQKATISAPPAKERSYVKVTPKPPAPVPLP